MKDNILWIVAAVLLIAFLVAPLIVYGMAESKEEDLSTDERFQLIEKFGVNTEVFFGRQTYIFADKHTGVMYLYVNGGSGAVAMTVMMDAEGKPLIWEGVK